MKLNSIKTLLLLLVWLAIGIALRLTNLAAKPPWTDEFCTLVFSLGNSFHSVPLDRAIALDVLLQPLHPNPNTQVTDVLQHLLTETNHPPVYFLLTHWWMQRGQSDAVGLASIWAARSLSVLFGAASIPAIYGLAWLAFRSPLVSHLAAAIMAVSPYGIFIAQEARHYSLAILWVIASISCLVIATRHIQNRTSLPIWVTASWIVINFLGISTHYFFSLALSTEAFVLLALAWRQKSKVRNQETQVRSQKRKFPFILPLWGSKLHPSSFILSLTPHSPWWQILAVAVGALIGGLVWLPLFLNNSHGGELTAWIQGGDKSVITLISPIFQGLAVWLTMLYLLPVEANSLPIVIVSGGLMLIFLLWALPIFRHGIVTRWRQPATRLMTQLFVGLVLSAIALFFFFAYVLNIDLTRGARYSFILFPAVIVLIGASLAVTWYEQPVFNFKKSRFFWQSGKASVTIIWLMGLLGALTVLCNLGYQKYYRPDLLVELMQSVSHSPIVVVTTHKTHVQTGEMMGIAREFKLAGSKAAPQFFLAHQDQNTKISTDALQQALSDLPRPLDLWLVNFSPPANFKNCVAQSLSSPPVDGYNYQLLHCNLTESGSRKFEIN